MKILNFGSCNIDYVYNVDEIVVPAETKQSDSLEIFAGGKGLNQSIAAAYAGCEIYHAGFIGNEGLFLKEMLEKSSVNTEFLTVCDGKSGHAIIQVSSKGQNSIILYAGANHAFTKEKVDEILSHFSKGDFLILQNETNLVDYIISKGAKKGLRIVFNPAPFNNSLKEIDYNKVEYLILNEVEIGGVSGKTSALEGLAFLNEKLPETKVILTLGSDGCAFFKEGEIVTVPAFKVDAVDTTAAGDTFIGFFVKCISSGESIESAVKISQAASAISVTKKGAAPSIPDYNQVLDFLKN